MTILHTYPNQNDFHLFVNCVEYIYPESQWKMKKSETVPLSHLNTCIVLLKDNQSIARASVYLNSDLAYKENKVICIGNYECINDKEAARYFHQQIEGYCKQLDGTFMIGPMNGSTWENYRFNYQHTEPLFLTEQLHPDYYNDFFTDWGMRVISDYFSSYTEHIAFVFEEIKEMELHFSRMNVVIRSIKSEIYEEELDKLYPFLSEAFKTNFLYTPISKEEFVKKYTEYKPLVNSDFVLLAEDEHNDIVGVIFCIQNLYNTEEKELIIKTIARNPNEQWRGIGHLMGQRIYKTAFQQGFKKIIHAFMKAEGTSSRPSDNFLGTPFKHYKLYGKTI